MLTQPNGLALVDKPTGWTSHDVVAKARGCLQIRSIGHAGTLDPFASGLLILGVGASTKHLTKLIGLDKQYLATVLFGATSTTFDPEGVITPITVTEPPTQSQLNQALDHFRGGYDQSAPLFSAKKLHGQSLYKLARQNRVQDIDRPHKQVIIHGIDIIDYTWPTVKLHIHCGSGTYIRSLADDLGRLLGIGGYCQALRRTHIGPYDIQHAVSPAQLCLNSLFAM